jgi:hypothetical protein
VIEEKVWKKEKKRRPLSCSTPAFLSLYHNLTLDNTTQSPHPLIKFPPFLGKSSPPSLSPLSTNSSQLKWEKSFPPSFITNPCDERILGVVAQLL